MNTTADAPVGICQGPWGRSDSRREKFQALLERSILHGAMLQGTLTTQTSVGLQIQLSDGP